MVLRGPAACALLGVMLGGCEVRVPRAAPAVPASPATSAARPAPAVEEGAQQVADLGICALESGEKIQGCKIGYRTFGTLDAARSNAVVWLTWFTGTTESVVDLVPKELVDAKRWYVVLIDALGDGVSSSPSNSTLQPRLAFPKFTIRDMVESQRRVLVERLGISHVHAIGGISMGGMQTFQWAVSHPAFMDRVVPIVGSPQLTSHDLLLWTAELHALERDVLYKNGEYEGRPLLRAVLDIHELALTTPAFRSGETSRADFSAWLDGKENDDHFDWNDWRRQLEAMLAHDVAKPWNGSLEEAAKRVKAKALVAVAEHDHAVSPIPALAFAKHMGAETLVMKSPCGHFAPGCEEHGELVLRVQEFLARR